MLTEIGPKQNSDQTQFIHLFWEYLINCRKSSNEEQTTSPNWHCFIYRNMRIGHYQLCNCKQFGIISQFSQLGYEFPFLYFSNVIGFDMKMCEKRSCFGTKQKASSWRNQIQIKFIMGINWQWLVYRLKNNNLTLTAYKKFS